MGLFVALALAAVVLGVLWATRRVRGAAFQLVSAALLFGLAGYALQGEARLTGSPSAERVAAPLPPAMPTDLAAEFYGAFNAATPWLAIANGYLRRGDSEGAVATLTSAVRASPRTSELWIALGNAMVAHNGGRSSPASELAFQRSASLAPRHPAPRFFYGLSLLRQGQVEPGLALWKELLASAPTDATWRVPLAARIAVIEGVRDGASPPGAPVPPTRPAS